MDGRDDDVERREELVLVVERRVGTDLELAAVEQPEALLRRLGRRRAGGLLRANRAFSSAMIARSSSTRSGVSPFAIARDWLWSVRTS